MAASHLRVISNGILGHKTRVLYVDSDGNETDISDVVAGIELVAHLRVGDLNKATLHTIKVDADIRVIAEQVEREMLKRARRGTGILA